MHKLCMWIWCIVAGPQNQTTNQQKRNEREKKSVTAHKNARLKTIRKSELNKMNERPTNRPTERMKESLGNGIYQIIFYYSNQNKSKYMKLRFCRCSHLSFYTTRVIVYSRSFTRSFAHSFVRLFDAIGSKMSRDWDYSIKWPDAVNYRLKTVYTKRFIDEMQEMSDARWDSHYDNLALQYA